MKCAIVSVGTEILFGQITNTNTVYLSQQLNLLGFDVLYHHTVGDNDGRLRKVLTAALETCDLVLCTGGLGPTEDDMTKETVCDVMQDHLVEHAESLAALYEHAKSLHHSMTKNNLKQAMLPSRAEVFANEVGTAPGFVLSHNMKYVICMPGPPREMTYMFQHHVKPFLSQFVKEVIYYQTVRTYRIGESSLETRLLDLIDGQTDPTIATYAKEGECSVRIASKRPSLAEAKEAVSDMIAKIRMRVGEYIFSENDEDLPEVVVRKLLEENISISCCESCTGGMFADTLASIAGISAVFDRGLVTYTERAKKEELSVKEETLLRYTVYSAEVAQEMAEGLRDKTGSDLCISITGVAGPEDFQDIAAGTAWIACTYRGTTFVRKLQGRNVNRNWNRNYMVLAMFDMILRILEGRPIEISRS